MGEMRNTYRILVQVKVFMVVTPHSVVVGYHCFRGCSFWKWRHCTASQPRDLKLNLHCHENLKSYKMCGKPEGKRLPLSHRHRWEDDIRMDLKEIG